MKNKIKIDKYYLLIVLAGSLFGFLFSLLQCPIIKKDILNLIWKWVNKMYSKLKTVLPNDHLIGKISLFLSVMAMFFAV